MPPPSAVPVILALDSSNDAFSAAINSADGIAVKTQQGKAHATFALPLVNALLAEQRLALADCDAFAFSAGPGKFSALRLVCAIAGGFSYAQQKPLVAVPGFAALAQANYGKQAFKVKCALPAHQGHVYYGVCQHQRGRWQVQRAAVCSADAPLPNAALRHACGAGYLLHPQLLADGEHCRRAPYPTAAAVWEVGSIMLAGGETSDPLACAPIYLRHKVADTIRQRQCKKNSSKN